jgi:hypothetical protein
MKSAVETARRLLDTLETFVMQERILLRAGHFTEMAAVQRRASPVIARLCQLGSEPGVASLRGRVVALLARRRENLSCLMERRAFLCEARERLVARRQQLQFVAAYRRPQGVRRIKRLDTSV